MAKMPWPSGQVIHKGVVTKKADNQSGKLKNWCKLPQQYPQAQTTEDMMDSDAIECKEVEMDHEGDTMEYEEEEVEMDLIDTD